MGKHSKQPGRRTAQRRSIATVELVDISGTAHRVTVDAAAEGLPAGRYATVCGTDVVAAALVARAARFCRLRAPLVTQRSRSSR
jgi:hypothetical protein